MHQLKPKKFYMHTQRGITLIESLAALVVTALGILGILGVQMRTLTDTSTTVRRAQAIRLIEDFSERLKASPNSLVEINNYTSGFAEIPTKPDCSTGCTNAQLVAYEVANWKNSVKDTLPLGQASIFTPTAEDEATAGQRRQLGIMIAWRENERDNDPSYKNAIDATKAYNNAGDLVTAGRDEPTNICPTGATCHLQYIPVAARCAPYSPGGATSTFYCPGS